MDAPLGEVAIGVPAGRKQQRKDGGEGNEMHGLLHGLGAANFLRIKVLSQHRR